MATHDLVVMGAMWWVYPAYWHLRRILVMLVCIKTTWKRKYEFATKQGNWRCMVMSFRPFGSSQSIHSYPTMSLEFNGMVGLLWERLKIGFVVWPSFEKVWKVVVSCKIYVSLLLMEYGIYIERKIRSKEVGLDLCMKALILFNLFWI